MISTAEITGRNEAEDKNEDELEETEDSSEIEPRMNDLSEIYINQIYINQLNDSLSFVPDESQLLSNNDISSDGNFVNVITSISNTSEVTNLTSNNSNVDGEIMKQQKPRGNRVRKDVKLSIMLANARSLAPKINSCLLYTSPSPRDRQKSRMPSSA